MLKYYYLSFGKDFLFAIAILFASSNVYATEQTNSVLDFTIEELLDLEISSISSLRPKSIHKSPGTVSVITSETISSMPAITLTDILKTLPGFDVRYSNFGETFVSSIGVDNPSNILVMIDGHRLNNFFSGMPIYDLPVDNIERLEIIRGPGSSLYGTNAMVAVINVITKKREIIKAKVAGGSFNARKVNVEYGTVGKDFSMHTFIEASGTSGAKGTVYSDTLYAATNTNQYSKAPMNQKDDKQKLFAHLGLDYKKIEFGFNYYKEDRGPNFAYQSILSDKSKIKSEYLNIDISRSYGTLETVKLVPRIYHDRWRSDQNIQLYPDGYTDNRDLDNDGDVEFFSDGIWQQKKYELRTSGIELKATKGFGSNHIGIVGVVAEASRLTDTTILTNYSGEPTSGAIVKPYFSNWNNYDLPEKERKVYSVFLQDDWELNDNFNLVLGVRYDNYSDFGSTTNPRIAAVITPWNSITLKLQYATAFRAPTFKELYDRTDSQFYGNPNLTAEKLESYEVGVSLNFNRANYLRLNFFKTNITNHITTLFNTSLSSITEYENGGELDITGYSAEAKHFFSDVSSIFWNATLFNAKNKQSGTWLTRIPQLRSNIGIDKELFNNAIFSLYWNYSGTAKTNARTDQERALEARASTGPYHLINAAITKKNLSGQLSVKFSVFNLLNTNYKELYSDKRFRLPEVGSPYETKNLIQSNQRVLMLELEKVF